MEIEGKYEIVAIFDAAAEVRRKRGLECPLYGYLFGMC
jgi:hypothetical protein